MEGGNCRSTLGRISDTLGTGQNTIWINLLLNTEKSRVVGTPECIRPTRFVLEEVELVNHVVSVLN